MEKIKHIEITNFKSIKHLEINDCNKINVFIGMPNAGKSNILEALGLFGMISKQNNILLENLVRFKNSSELFFEENITQNIIVKINQIPLILLSIEAQEQRGKNYSKISNVIKFDVEILSYGSDSMIPLKKYLFKEQYLKLSFNKDSLDYPNGNNLVQIISSNPVLRKEVNKLFHENNLKLLIEKRTNELKIFKEYKDGTVFTLPYELIADTLQRLIFYKAAIMSNQDSALLFEEPEAHCFEPYILEFTNAVKYDENDNQFFIVTHSEFILQEFLRDEESKKNTNIYLVNNIDGETKVKLLAKNNNDDVYEFGMNPFFNFEKLWENN